MFVRFKGKGNNFQNYVKNFNKQRLIFLERLIENNTERKINYNEISNFRSFNHRFVVVLNYCKKLQNNPDNHLIEEEVHTFNTYYGCLYVEPNKSVGNIDLNDWKKLRSSEISMNSTIFIEDYNFNIIYNQTNKVSNYYENYNRYQNNSIYSPTFRTSIDSIEEMLDCPHPKYYTMEEQKYADNYGESMRELLMKNYNKSTYTPLLSFPISELVDENTKIGELTLVLNNLTIIQDAEDRDKLKADIYNLISSIKYDMEFCGISKIVGLITSDKGYNFTQMNTVIPMNDQLTKTCVSMFLENFQNRYEEIFQAIVTYLLYNQRLTILFSLEPIQNIVEVSIEEGNKNKLEMLQQDIHDQLINTIF